MLLLAGWGQLPWVGLAVWTIASAAEWLATPADPAAMRLLDLVGLRAQYRALLRSLTVAGLLVAVAAPSWAVLGYLSAVLFVQLAWVAQPALATWLAASAPPLRYQPESSQQPEPLVDHARAYARAVGTGWLLPGLELVAVGAGLATAMLPAAVGLAVYSGVVVGAIGYLAWTAQQARCVRLTQGAMAASLMSELAASAPVFLVYVSLAARQSKYIVNQWIPVFEAATAPGLMVVREASQLSPLRDTRHPVIYTTSNRDVEQLVLASVRVAFYLAYGERNTTLLRETSIRHVMLAHGDSDKATSASALIRAFDETWVAGQAAIDRFRAAGVALEASRFAVIGRPQAAQLPVGPSGREPKVVLYAPTFEGYYAQVNHSSLDVFGIELVRRLLQQPGITVWFRPHPASGVLRSSMLTAISEIDNLLQAADGAHRLVSDLDLTTCLAGTDVLIADVSSLISDFLFTERPVIVCNPHGTPEDAFVAAHPSQASSYLLTPDLAGLEGILAQALADDPLLPARIAMKEHVLGDPPGGPQAAFNANLARITAGR